MVKPFNTVGAVPIPHLNSIDNSSQGTALDSYPRISSLTLYIPEAINIDRILEEAPPEFRYQRDYFVYIIHLIHAIPARKRDVIEGSGGYTFINRKYLQKRIHGYKKYIEYLKRKGIVVERNVYIPGRQSKGLKISRRYQSPLIPVLITKKTLIKSIVYLHKEFNVEITEELGYLQKWFDDKIEVDYESGKAFLQEQYENEVANPEVENEMLRYNSRLLPFLKLRDKDYSFYVDKTGYRLHTNFTQIMSPLRRFIKYDGKMLCAIDITNSQLFLSVGLLDDDIFKENDIINHITNPKILTHPNYPIMVAKKIGRIKNKPDVILFRDYVSRGCFYEYFGNRLVEEGLMEEGENMRAVAKEITFTAIYSPNTSIGYNNEMKLFRSLFPNVYKIYELIKKGRGNHPALAICLQRFEADLVLHDACGKISKDRPDVFIATLHDAIITTEDNAEYVKEVFENVLRTRLEVTPPLEIERWE